MNTGKPKTVVTKYHIPSDKTGSFKIALAADLHERQADETLALLKRESPDLIIAAGDILERCTEGMSPYTKDGMDAWQGITREKKASYWLLKGIHMLGKLLYDKKRDYSGGLEFLAGASETAPVCYGIGNHEWYFLDSDQEIIERSGIYVLDNQDIVWDLERKRPISTEISEIGNRDMIRIGGLSTRYDLDWLEHFSRKDGYKILICHHPEYYDRYIKGTELDTFSLILSGHVHGGQWRIGDHGFMAPGQGLFPKYCHGIYDGKLVVSAGLANTSSIPRFGNPAELVVVQVDGRD